jgi:hypothetical protein
MLLLREQDFEHAINMMEQETILTPVQKEFSKYPIDAAAFRMHGYFPEGGNDIDDIMKIEPQILHSMI